MFLFYPSNFIHSFLTYERLTDASQLKLNNKWKINLTKALGFTLKVKLPYSVWSVVLQPKIVIDSILIKMVFITVKSMLLKSHILCLASFKFWHNFEISNFKFWMLLQSRGQFPFVSKLRGIYGKHSSLFVHNIGEKEEKFH